MHTLEQLRSGALAGARRLDLAGGLAELPDDTLLITDAAEPPAAEGSLLEPSFESDLEAPLNPEPPPHD